MSGEPTLPPQVFPSVRRYCRKFSVTGRARPRRRRSGGPAPGARTRRGAAPGRRAGWTPDPSCGPDEVRMRVERLNLDAASFRQLPRAARRRRRGACAPRCSRSSPPAGKMQNPVTGSGGMLVGTRGGGRAASPRSGCGRRPGGDAGLAHADAAGDRGRARAAGTGLASRCRPTATRSCSAAASPRVLPDDLPAATRPGGAGRLRRPGADRPRGGAVRRRGTAPVVAVIGGGREVGLAESRRCPARRRRADDRRRARATPRRDAARRAGLADEVVLADARDPVALRDAVAARRGPGRRHRGLRRRPRAARAGAILATADGGTVIFFSMATSFTAAALGAEGLAADVTMLVGNGYVPGHAELRARPAAHVTRACADRLRGAHVTTLLLRGGTVHRHRATGATALAVEDGRIVFVGADDAAAAYDGADEVVDLHGALVAPAFVDAHVHTVLTGFPLTRLDLRWTRTLAEALDRVAEQAAIQPRRRRASAPAGRSTLARGPAADDGGARAGGAGPAGAASSAGDCHSSVVSPALAGRRPGAAAPWTATTSPGGVERDARHAVDGGARRAGRPRAAPGGARGRRRWRDGRERHRRLPRERRAAHRPGLRARPGRARRRDAGLPADLLLGHPRPATTATRSACRSAGLAGDLNADGAIGSRTAALHADYDDQPGNRGHAYLTAEEIADHLVACTRTGLQGGFHCIGDAALEAITDGFALAEKRIGRRGRCGPPAPPRARRDAVASG